MVGQSFDSFPKTSNKLNAHKAKNGDMLSGYKETILNSTYTYSTWVEIQTTDRRSYSASKQVRVRSVVIWVVEFLREGLKIR